MKSLKEITGLRIISVADGTQVGNIKDVVLNPQGGSLDFFIVDQPSDYLGAKIIAFSDVFGLGEFALTIPNLQVIQDVAQNLAAQELLKQDVRIIGTRVLTKKGQLTGEVTEVHINEDSGKIEACSYVNNNGDHLEVSAQQIITYGKELLIIEEAGSAEEKIASPEAAPAIEIESNDKINEDVTADQDEASFNLFEQRQLQYFVGKMVEKDITLDNGEILHSGQPMTEETVSKITTRSTLMEITSHLMK